MATLRQINEDLRTALLRLLPEHRHCSTLKPQDFSHVLSHLLRARECLCASTVLSQASSELEKEKLRYRGHLETLNTLLPDVQLRLLAERSRIETAQGQLTATSAWLQASRKTL